MPSTESSPETSTLTPEQAIQEALVAKAGLSRLLAMVGIDSLERGIADEDAAVKRQMDADHAAIYGGGPVTAPNAGEDDVGNKYMVAGNMTVTHPSPVAKEGAAVAKTGGGVVPKILMAAALLGGGAGLGYILNDWRSSEKPAATFTDTDTIVELDFPKE